MYKNVLKKITKILEVFFVLTILSCNTQNQTGDQQVQEQTQGQAEDENKYIQREVQDNKVELISKNGLWLNCVKNDGENYSVDLGDEEGDLYLVISNLNVEEDFDSPITPMPVITGLVPDTSAIIQNTVINPFYDFLNSNESSTNVEDLFSEKFCKEEYDKESDEILSLDNAGEEILPFRSKGGFEPKGATLDWVSPYESLQEGDIYNLYSRYAGANIECELIQRKKIGNRSLFIFSSDNTISSSFYESLSNALLNESGDDIWNLLNNVFGEEWGEIPNWKTSWNNSSNLNFSISNNGVRIGYDENDRKIIIALIPLNEYNANLGGYCLSSDTYVKGMSKNSNEATIVFINSDRYKDNLVGCLTTIAHELQHAITYYQRYKFGYNPDGSSIGGMKREGTSIFSTELFSTLAEEMIAEKFNGSGPGKNNATTGNYPEKSKLKSGSINTFLSAQRFNALDFKGVRDNVYETYPYGINYVLGAFLVRNYGIEFIRNYQKNEMEDKESSKRPIGNIATVLVDSINKSASRKDMPEVSWEQILRGWGVSILLSDEYDTVYPYKLSIKNSDNDYWFYDVFYKGNKIPSVNLWPFTSVNVRYLGSPDYSEKITSTGPLIFNSKSDRNYSLIENKKISSNSNVFLLIKRNASGIIPITINGDSNLRYTFVLKQVVKE